MNISIVTGPFLSVPPAPCGAVERLWKDLAERFAAHGHKVTLFCRDHPALGSDHVVNRVRYVKRGRLNRSKSLLWDIARDFGYARRMVRLLPDADIVVCNTFWLPLLALQKPRAGRVVVNIQRVPKGQMKLYRRVPRFAAVSNAMKTEVLRELPGAESKITVIGNPVDAQTFCPPDAPRDYASSTKTLLYTGRLHPEKGVHVLVDAFKLLAPENPGLKLRLVGATEVKDGGGGDVYIDELKSKAQDLPVEFVPPIYGRAALAHELQSAHFYAYPSLADGGEAFGVAPLEAMATGLVPVVSKLACFEDFLIDGETGRVFDHHAANPPLELANALRRVMNDVDETRVMSERGVKVAQHFDYERIAQAYLNDWSELLKV